MTTVVASLPASPVVATALATHTLAMHVRPLAQSNVRVHDSPALLVASPVGTLVVVVEPQPTAMPRTDKTPTKELKRTLDTFMDMPSLS